MSQREQQHIGRSMNIQVIHDRVDPLHIHRNPLLDVQQVAHLVGRGPSWRGHRQGGSCSGLESSEHGAFIAASLLLRSSLALSLKLERYGSVRPSLLLSLMRNAALPLLC
jgi:hypothetical protein